MSRARPHNPDRTLVVRAYARRGDHVLLVRRAPGDSLAGRYELPGGKVSALGDGTREDPIAALRREFREETGLELTGDPRLIDERHCTSPRGCALHLMTFEMHADGEPELSEEHDAARWHRPGDELPGATTDDTRDALAQLA